MKVYVIRIDCKDEPGLVQRITGALYKHGSNIISNHEFVDPGTGHFFMRTAFECQDPPHAVVPAIRALLPDNATVELAATGKRRILVLATKEPHCLGDLLLRTTHEDFPAQILAVISNHAVLAPLVQQFGVPFHHLSHEGRARGQYERELLECMGIYDHEYIVLAKFMRVLSPEFVSRFPSRILNIHHSFLPAFVGAQPYRQAYERGVKLIGATGHLVTDELDTGPIIAQAVAPVTHTANASDMAQAGRDVEKMVLAKSLRLLLEERIFLHNHRTIIFE